MHLFRRGAHSRRSAHLRRRGVHRRRAARRPRHLAIAALVVVALLVVALPLTAQTGGGRTYSDWSESVTVTTLEAPAPEPAPVEEPESPLAAPRNIQAKAESHEALTVRWVAVPEADGYEVECGDRRAETRLDAHTFTALESSTTYECRVRAFVESEPAAVPTSPPTAEPVPDQTVTPTPEPGPTREPEPDPTTGPEPEPTPLPEPAPEPEPDPTATSEPAAEPTQPPPPPADLPGVAHGAEIGPRNTGPRVADSELEVVNGNVATTQDGEIIERKYVNGHIDIRHANVVIRDTVVNCPGCGAYAIGVAFENRDNVSNTTVEWTRVEARGSQRIAINLWPGQATIHRVQVVEGGPSGIRLYSGHTVTETFVGRQHTWPGSHNTAMSTHGGSNITVRRSNLIGTTSAALALYSESPITNAVVEDNLFSGGSYCVNAGDNKNGGSNNLRFVGNQFSRDLFENCGRFGPYFDWDGSAPGNVWTGNTWQDTGEPVG